VSPLERGSRAGNESVDVEALAEGLWLRLREVILAERGLERFAFAPEAPVPGAVQALTALAADPDARRGLARDMVLRALAAAADPASFGILAMLAPGEPVPLAELGRRLGLPALAVAERLSALAQVGLAARDLERDAALATPAGRRVAALVEALGAALHARLGRDLPGLLGS
jgi:hypothetical protein